MWLRIGHGCGCIIYISIISGGHAKRRANDIRALQKFNGHKGLEAILSPADVLFQRSQTPKCTLTGEGSV